MKSIGIDVHKRIYTACIPDDSEKLVGEPNDIQTALEGLQRLTEPCPPEDCPIVFENLGRAHFVKRILNDMGYSLEAAHTGHGAMRQIASANLKTDPIDAYKLALAAKDLWMGRRYIRTAHPSSDENMRTEALCRIVAECAEIGDETDLRIKEYIPLHNIEVPAGYKHVWTKGSTKSLLERNDPALTIMVNMFDYAISRIDHAEEGPEEIYRDDDGIRMLRSIKGIATRTAAYILTAIDGIERHDTPEKPVPYFGFAAVHRESAGNVKKGHITKEGDPLVRRYVAGAVIEHSSYCPDSGLSQSYRRLKKTKAHRCAVTAAAGKPTCMIWAILTRKDEYRFHPEA